MTARTLTIPAPIPTGGSVSVPGPLNDGDAIAVHVAATTHAPTIAWGSSAHMPSPGIAPLAGLAYIWLVDTGDIASVLFTLDGKVPHVESWPPYDFAGTAPDGTSGLPWDTTKTPDGSHTIGAIVTYRDGSTATATASLTLLNVAPPPPPPPIINPSDLQADIAAAGNGSKLDITGYAFTVPSSGYNAAGKTGIHLVGGTLNSPTAQAALGPGVDWWLDGLAISCKGNHGTYASAIWAYGAHGLRISNPNITDYMYAAVMILNSHGAGEDAVWDGGGYIARGVGSVASSWNVYGIAHTSDGPSKFSDNFIVRGTAAKPWVIEDIPAWQGVNCHNAKTMTYEYVITRRVRRAFWFSPIGGMITGLLVTHCRAEDPGASVDPTAYFTSDCDSARFIDNFMSNRYPRYDANDGVRDYGGDVGLVATGMSYG